MRCRDYQQKKKTWLIVDFADHMVRLKERKKRDKYLVLASELKNLLNMKVTMILIVVEALSIVTIRLVQGLEDLKLRGRVGVIQTTVSLKSNRIL